VCDSRLSTQRRLGWCGSLGMGLQRSMQARVKHAGHQGHPTCDHVLLSLSGLLALTVVADVFQFMFTCKGLCLEVDKFCRLQARIEDKTLTCLTKKRTSPLASAGTPPGLSAGSPPDRSQGKCW